MPCTYELMLLGALLTFLGIAGYFLHRTAKNIDTYLISSTETTLSFDTTSNNSYPPKTIFAFGTYYVLKESV